MSKKSNYFAILSLVTIVWFHFSCAYTLPRSLLSNSCRFHYNARLGMEKTEETKHLEKENDGFAPQEGQFNFAASYVMWSSALDRSEAFDQC